jgi:sirohydrochlorin cobaltochelatase
VNSGSRKKAILVVSFGTSFEENLKATIGATEKRIGVANPDYEIRRAFTSSIVIGILEKRGIVVDTVDAAVRKLVAEGFPELIVQALHLIPGEEFHKLLASVAPYRASFARFAVGMPLFAGTDGYFGTIDAIAAGFPEIGPADAIVLMGHGSSHPANSAYALIQTIFEAKKLPVYIGTIEGYPTLDDVIVKLRKNGVRKTIVLPLMLVAGDHANNDMAGDGPDSWKSILGSNGFVVETLVRGLGQLPAIQDIYVARTKAAIDSLDAPGKGNA